MSTEEIKKGERQSFLPLPAKIMKNKLEKFKKILKIKNQIVGIYYTETKPRDAVYYRDTACTALARALIKKEVIFFSNRVHRQLCSGADYFLKLADVKTKEAIRVYVGDEQIFRNKIICRKFLKILPKFPTDLKNRFIVIRPLREGDKPDIVILLLNPAQAGRIIGLFGYDGAEPAKVFPNQPACLAFFTPLATNVPHINFIDYYDRYYQGRVKNKFIWPEDKALVSLTFNHFRQILRNLDKSPQGSFKPRIKPQKVEKF